jgi:hypothetical protein
MLPKASKTNFKQSSKDIECDKSIPVINQSPQINRSFDVIKAAIQFVPNLGHQIMKSSCNVHGTYELPEVKNPTNDLEISSESLGFILEGIRLNSIQKRKRFSLRKSSAK